LALSKRYFLWVFMDNVKFKSNIVNKKPIIAIEIYALLATVLLVIVNFTSPRLILLISPYLLLVGMAFPGIPHGAIDHHLDTQHQAQKYFLYTFILKYLSIMAMVFLIWWLNPLLGLALFIAYSAWHFGETDFRRLNSFHPLSAFLGGLSLLTFILSSHPDEFVTYLFLFGIVPTKTLPDWFLVPAVLSFVAFGFIGLLNVKDKWVEFICILLVLLLGTQLPLLLAFGCYFILIHSLTGWRDIRNGLKTNDQRLFFQALPFSLGAFVFFAGFIWISNDQHYLPQQYIPSFFIGLSCISAPHVLFMSKFYRALTS